MSLQLAIFDFDLTLFRSPEAPEWWDKKKYEYWYSQYASLGSPFVPETTPSEYWVSEMVDSARDNIADNETWAVLCTGRIDRIALRYRVAELLAQKNLNFDQVILNDTGLKTPAYKEATVNKLLKKYPKISKVTLYEDSQDNIDIVEALCKKKGVEFEGKLVKVNPHPLPDFSEEDYIAFL